VSDLKVVDSTARGDTCDAGGVGRGRVHGRRPAHPCAGRRRRNFFGPSLNAVWVRWGSLAPTHSGMGPKVKKLPTSACVPSGLKATSPFTWIGVCGTGGRRDEVVAARERENRGGVGCELGSADRAVGAARGAGPRDIEEIGVHRDQAGRPGLDLGHHVDHAGEGHDVARAGEATTGVRRSLDVPAGNRIHAARGDWVLRVDQQRVTTCTCLSQDRSPPDKPFR